MLELFAVVGWWTHFIFELAFGVLSLFLILLILVQRGRGGGLAGALGGMGGQSAFGTKAGDTFTWITYCTAAVWILLAMLTIKVFTNPAAEKAQIAARQRGELNDEATSGDASTKKTEDKSAEPKTDASKGATEKPVDEKVEAKSETPAVDNKTDVKEGPKTEKTDEKVEAKKAPEEKSADAKVEEPKTEAPKTDAPKADAEKATPENKPADEPAK